MQAKKCEKQTTKNAECPFRNQKLVKTTLMGGMGALVLKKHDLQNPESSLYNALLSDIGLLILGFWGTKMMKKMLEKTSGSAN